MQTISVTEIKKGERTKKGTASVYHQYTAAGSCQGVEFFHIRRPCGLHSSSMKVLILREMEQWVLSHICVPILPVFRKRQMRHARSIYWRTVWRTICGIGKTQRRVPDRRFRMHMRQSVRRDVTRTPAAVKESLVQRSVPPVSADLETFYCKPYGACKI